MYQHLLHFFRSAFVAYLDKSNLRFRFWKIFTHLYYVFLINPTVKRTIVAFPFNIKLIAFSLYYFFNSKLFLICFEQFFFGKRSKNFFAFKITNNICPRHSVFNFFNHKKENFSGQFRT